jgi:uncharacterized membrane-anchored protein YhcB (DUF1043 family)
MIQMGNRLAAGTLAILAGMSLAALAVHAADTPLKKDELKNLISNAKTPEEHERIAQHFIAKAEQLEADAQDHVDLAAKYKASSSSHDAKHAMSGPTASHCENVADGLKRAAAASRQLAADHRAMAKQCCAGGPGH